MANTKFDAKSFHPEAFQYIVDRVPNLNTHELRRSQALAQNPDIKNVFSTQNGVEYARLAMRGMLDGEAVNYDGKTDIPATGTKSFERGVVVVGRAKAWVEKDFAYDITGGVDFMQNVAEQVAEYKDGLDQATILAVLDGIFQMNSTDRDREFVEKHTYDVSGRDDGVVGPTTLNKAANRACGAGKKKFSLVFMHSDVATTLENLNLLEHLKFTDQEGITRDLELGTWNGKLVVVDDNMPAEEIPESQDGANDGYTRYTTYVLGAGAIDFEDIEAKVPYEMNRDPSKNGGEDTLYMRSRKVFAPYGISYEKKNQRSLSPTDDELRDGNNWTLVHSGETDPEQRTYINHKAIPIARIISKG